MTQLAREVLIKTINELEREVARDKDNAEIYEREAKAFRLRISANINKIQELKDALSIMERYIHSELDKVTTALERS